MEQAILPDNLEEITISDFLEGEEGYTVPWAMYSDENGYLWLNGNYSYHKRMMGTSTLKISKTEGMFIVDVTYCKDRKWSPGEAFVGEFKPLPVSKLTGNS